MKYFFLVFYYDSLVIHKFYRLKSFDQFAVKTLKNLLAFWLEKFTTEP